MGAITKSPTRLAGANVSSGNLNTGEVPWTRGGARAVTVYSGAIAMSGIGSAVASGGSVLFFSGAGRINTFTALFPAGVAIAGNGQGAIISGIPIVVYDAGITARSGLFTDATLSESGARPLFVWQPPIVLSGANFPTPGYTPTSIDMPFTSGLCVMALSGSPGFSMSFTPETNPFASGVSGGVTN